MDLVLLRAKIKSIDYLDITEEPPKQMGKIYVAGYPFCKGLSDDRQLTQGIIINTKAYSENSIQIQFDEPINSINIGGPIVNEKGELVAVKGGSYHQIDFGLTSSSIKTLLNDNNFIKYSTSSLIKLWYGLTNKKLNKLIKASTVYVICN